jgi:hypothetical protein
MVESKATLRLVPSDEVQLVNYLTVTLTEIWLLLTICSATT